MTKLPKPCALFSAPVIVVWIARQAYDRVSVYDKNPKNSGLSECKDLMIASQAVANKAEVWSFDKAFRNNHRQLKTVMNLTVAPESYTIPLSNQVADYRVGRIKTRTGPG